MRDRLNSSGVRLSGDLLRSVDVKLREAFSGRQNFPAILERKGSTGWLKLDPSAGNGFPKDCPVIVTGVLSFDRRHL